MEGFAEEIKWIIFFIKDAEMLKKHTDIWINVSNSITKELDWKPIYIKKFLKTKWRSYSVETADAHSRKIPGSGSNHICWLVISIDCVFKKVENSYPQIVLKEWEYIEKEKEYIARKLTFFSDDPDKSDED